MNNEDDDIVEIPLPRVSVREFATIFAALHALKAAHGAHDEIEQIVKLATSDGDFDALSDDEIDTRAERIFNEANTDD